GAFQHAPAVDAVRVHELVHQPRLAYPSLAEQGDELTLPLGGLRQGLRQSGAPSSPRPCAPCARACVSTASSGSRPTKRVSPRATAACKRRWTGVAPTNSKTSTGSASPLEGIGPKGGARRGPSPSRRVAAVKRIVPGGANCSMRAARFVVRPTPE